MLTGIGLLWLAFVLVGLGTYLLRFSFIGLSERAALPEGFKQGLRFVPAAVLAALVAPALVYDGTALGGWLVSDRLVAGLLAVLVAWQTRSVLLTLIAGMVGLWMLQWLA